MPTLDMATQRRQQTTLGAVATALPWESELSELAVDNPDFRDALVLVIDGDLVAEDHDVQLDNLYPNDLDHPLPFLLLVRGSMRVRSVLNTDSDGGTHLVVLGDLATDFMITMDQETFVGGGLHVRRAWWGIGEAGRLMVRGLIAAPALIADGYRIDDERIRLRHGVTTTAFLWSDGTDHLPRAHVRCVFDERYIDDTAADEDDVSLVTDWVDVDEVLDALDEGLDPIADPIACPADDRFLPEPDLFEISPDEVFARFRTEVSAEALVAVLTDTRVMQECESYDDDLIDRDRKYSVRHATDTVGARLTIMRVLSDPEQRYRFHHFEARETSSGAIEIELLSQSALGADEEVVPVPRSDVGHYVDALSCFRRLRAFLARTP